MKRMMYPLLILLMSLPLTSAFSNTGNATESPAWGSISVSFEHLDIDFTRTYIWDIEKECLGPNPLVLEEGQVYNYPFRWTLSNTTQDSDRSVTGTVKIKNNGSNPVLVEDLVLSGGGYTITLNCPGGFPRTLAGGEQYFCTFSISPNNSNTFELTATAESGTTGVNDAYDSANVPFTAPTLEIDECASIWDDCEGYGQQGPYCYLSNGPMVFDYTCEIAYNECGNYEFENYVQASTNDSKTVIWDICTVEVEVECEEEGCTRTIGYWKTHSSYGPAPYDPTWALIGEDTPFFLSGKTNYQVMWTPPQGNAYYILAPQYIAAWLNQLAGAAIPPTVLNAFNTATDLLNTYTPTQVRAMRGNNPMRAQFISIAGILDDYNNGITGPGHCGGPSSAEKFEDYLQMGELELSAAPNPFAGQVQFDFSVPYDSPVTLELFNASGQKVGMVFSAYLEAGEQRTVSFDGASLPGGLYFYRLTTDRDVKTGQLVAMK
jgi:hypothetical protein